MKKLWIIGVAVLIVIGAIVAALTMGSSDKKDSSKTESDTTHNAVYGSKEACSILTQAVADKALGAGAEKGTNTPNSSSGDVSVSTCTYTSATDDSLESVRNLRAASLLVRAPLTAIGADSNHEPFNTLKSGASEVTGYGEKAFWDPNMGQFNILKEGTWYILSVGKTKVSEHTLADAKTFAESMGLK